VRVKDVMFPLGEGQFVPGYYLELWIKEFPAFSYVIDAIDTPDVLFRRNLTSRVAFTYRVHNTGDAICRPEDGPAPGTPHPHGVPNGFQAPTIQETLIEIESLLPGNPWLPAEAETTRGNNVIAYADLRGPDGLGPGDVIGRITSPRTFDYLYDHHKPASDPNNLQNSLVGMFFHVNWLHDRWYEAGFDEASGNAQQENFGRGGVGGDPILAEGHDFSGTDNANMATPADGASPKMQMFEFTGPSPQPSRTSNHEALITFHEMGHYITNRLVGNAAGLTNRQGRAMGEGWGDFFAICMTSQPTDDFHKGIFAVGGWTDLTATFRDNYYFSIRRYPYTADLTKSPLTFKHISNSVVLPVGPPRHPNAGGPNSEEHNAGEVWCAALWEVFVNLVAKHQHAAAENRMLTYVIGGLKVTPMRPTFTQARDAMIVAVSALEPDDLPDVWAGFAKRGMGVNAVSPPASSTSLAGVVESFDTP
jgi:extracellular elastinolytic metalloproteinase